MTYKPDRLLQDPLLRAAAAHPERVALYVEGNPHTYAQLLRAARRLAAALQARGLQRSDRVVLFMDNRFELAVGIYGTLLAGGTFVVVNAQTKADKLAHILRDSAAPILITEARLMREVMPACVGLNTLRSVLCAGETPEPLAGPTLESLEGVVASAPADIQDRGVIPLDLAGLIYTSGSTGNPKGVMMTHQNMLFAAGSLQEYLRLEPGHRILNVLPLAFDYGLYQLLMAMGIGGTLVLERGFTYPARILERMEALEIDVFPGVPTIFAMLLSMHRKTPLSFPWVKRVTNTAAALPADFVPGLRAMFPNALVYKMYGLTECKRVAYLEPEKLDRKPGSVGRAIPGTEVFLLSEDGKPVAPGERGILHVRGPHVMQGYLNLPEVTARMLKPGDNPWEQVLCTGDWFTQDEEGDLYFVGRSDDIIKSRGEKVAPVEVEHCLHGMPGVREAAVVGVPDEILGEAIRAVIVLDEGVQLDARAVQRYCAARLENFMVPRDVLFIEAFEKSPSGKIVKASLTGPNARPLSQDS